MRYRTNAVQVRFYDDEFKALENFRRRQPKIPPLAETVRMLIERGLRASETEEQAA